MRGAFVLLDIRMMFWTLFTLINTCRHVSQHPKLILRWKIKSAPHIFIKTCLIPNFFCKNCFFYVSKAPQAQRVMGALSDIQKRLKLTLTSLGIFFALPSSKNKCFRVRFAVYTDCSKNDKFCHFMMTFEKMLDFAIKIKFHGATLISLFSSILKIWI